MFLYNHFYTCDDKLNTLPLQLNDGEVCFYNELDTSTHNATYYGYDGNLTLSNIFGDDNLKTFKLSEITDNIIINFSKEIEFEKNSIIYYNFYGRRMSNNDDLSNTNNPSALDSKSYATFEITHSANTLNPLKIDSYHGLSYDMISFMTGNMTGGNYETLLTKKTNISDNTFYYDYLLYNFVSNNFEGDINLLNEHLMDINICQNKLMTTHVNLMMKENGEFYEHNNDLYKYLCVLYPKNDDIILFHRMKKGRTTDNIVFNSTELNITLLKDFIYTEDISKLTLKTDAEYLYFKYNGNGSYGCFYSGVFNIDSSKSESWDFKYEYISSEDTTKLDTLKQIFNSEIISFEQYTLENYNKYLPDGIKTLKMFDDEFILSGWSYNEYRKINMEQVNHNNTYTIN